MSNIETQYLQLLHDVLHNGEDRTDRTGTGTLSVFGRQMRADLSKDGFPLLTTKRVPWKSVLSELLWFIEGSGDERRLAEILHGTRDTDKTTIWTQNANADYWKDKAKFPGDLGRVYGVQWRNWTTTQLKWYEDYIGHDSGAMTFFGAKVTMSKTDQLQNIIDTIKKDPTSRRLILSAYNAGELDQMALPPCHMFAQFNVSQKRQQIDCQLYVRSNDLFLGAPFNIASYAALTHMIAQVTGYGVGELVYTIGDAHIYKNHVDQVIQQLRRAPYGFPSLHMNPLVDSIDGFRMEHFDIVGYNSWPAIQAPMAV